MQNPLQIIILFFAVITLSSCLKQSESIEAIAPAQTLAQLQREAMMSTALTAGNAGVSDTTVTDVQTSTDPEIFYLNLKYNIKGLDVYEAADVPNSFERLSNAFLRTLAKIVLRIKGPQTVEMDPMELELPDMNLDFDIVKSVQVKRVYLEYNKDFDASVNNKASFAFITSLNLNRVGKNKDLLFSYKSSNNQCKYKCIDFKIDNGNVYDLLANNNQSIILKPTLKIGSIPKVTELIIDGQVELQIGLKLPF